MTEKELRKQEIAKKMKELRMEAGLTQLQVAEKLGITYQAISNYERGKNSIEADLLVAMCNIYNVNPLTVLSSAAPDAKSEIWDVLNSEKSNIEEKCIAALGLLKIYFARSFGQLNYRFEHPKFDDYVAMLLNQNQFKGRFGEDVYNALVQRYGKQPGIPEGRTSYKIEENNLLLQTDLKRKAPFYSDEAMKLAADYDEKLDTWGRKLVRDVADNEIARCIAGSRTDLQEQQKKPILGNGDGLEEMFIQYVQALNLEQQRMILDQMQRMIGQQKVPLSVFSQQIIDETAQ